MKKGILIIILKYMFSFKFVLEILILKIKCFSYVMCFMNDLTDVLGVIYSKKFLLK